MGRLWGTVGEPAETAAQRRQRRATQAAVDLPPLAAAVEHYVDAAEGALVPARPVGAVLEPAVADDVTPETSHVTDPIAPTTVPSTKPGIPMWVWIAGSAALAAALALLILGG